MISNWIEKINNAIESFFNNGHGVEVFGWIAVMLFVAVVAYDVVHIFKKYKIRRIFNVTNVNIMGTFLSALILLWAIYYCGGTSDNEFWRTTFLSFQHSLRVFALDGDYRDLVAHINADHFGDMAVLYKIHAAVLYFYAPILTLSFIFTLLKNISAHCHYAFFFLRESHVFSELNERSLALAKDINAKWGKKVKIVFSDIIDKNEEEHTDLVDEAKEMGAILFRKDLRAINFRWKLSHLIWRKRLNFYLISEDESEKISHANHIRKKYDWKRVFLYVFSDDVSCEMLMSTKNQRHIRIARINDIQALIYHNLDEYGIRLFQNAALKNEYVISAVIVGLGKYGLEMLKALTWFCQFPGFSIKITAFDSDTNAQSRIDALCPDLLYYSGKKISGDAEYTINIHSGVDVESSEFIKKIEAVGDATFVFVCLGEDKRNLAVAKKLRETYEYMKIYPDIETVVYDTDTSKRINYKWERVIEKEDSNNSSGALFSGVKNHKSQPYKIHTIGDLESFYSVETLPLENNDNKDDNKNRSFGKLVELGKRADDRWGKGDRENAIATCNEQLKKLSPETEEEAQRKIEGIAEKLILDLEDINKKKTVRKRLIYLKRLINENSPFWRFEYNYRSSLAKVLHKELRKQMINIVDSSETNPFEKSISKNSEVRVHLNLGCPKGKDNESFNRVFEALKQTHLPEITRYAIDYVIAEEQEDERIKEENAKLKAGETPKKSPFDRSNLCRMDFLCIGELEHRRWNAYMRTEGYRGCYKDGTVDRNDLGRIHNNLVPLYKLNNKSLENDI